MADWNWSSSGWCSINLRWCHETKSITLNEELKDKKKEQVTSLASIAKELANGSDGITNDDVIKKLQ